MIKSACYSILKRLARAPIFGVLMRLGFRSMSFAIPVNKLRETSTLMAFHHPSPDYALHILIVPKRAYRSLMDLSPADAEFHRDLFETVQSLIDQYGLEPSGYRLIANGGAFQDAPILHFHLVSEMKTPTNIARAAE